ncbi:MAG TPA: hypothetical protein VM925_11355 [Labilithrix sp.]|nr:hypothetical protein [Labilithrix sp.]
MTSLVTMLARIVFDHACPSCPAGQEAREVFFSEDLVSRLGGMFGPFLVTAAAVALVVSRVGAKVERPNDPLPPEAKP